MHDKLDYLIETLEDIKRDLRELSFRQTGQWVSVTREVPISGQYVLFCGYREGEGVILQTQLGIYHNNGMFVSFFPPDELAASETMYGLSRVTHWQRIPQPVGWGSDGRYLMAVQQ